MYMRFIPWVLSLMSTANLAHSTHSTRRLQRGGQVFVLSHVCQCMCVCRNTERMHVSACVCGESACIVGQSGHLELLTVVVVVVSAAARNTAPFAVRHPCGMTNRLVSAVCARGISQRIYLYDICKCPSGRTFAPDTRREIVPPAKLLFACVRLSQTTK